LKILLKEGGGIIATIPIGYNKVLDKEIDRKKYKIIACMKRKNFFNDWEETTWKKAKNVKYAEPFDNANAIVIIKIP
ncbi:hypothetical protein KKB11_06125, partial [Candidatus Micrarchaeota archaeon]|nr:hypothetical protein [Candidatus Micrarchaeota archaeon]